ncbi:MAG: WD40 repeat domain-containing protein [Proteobacteria bacterium]|nr:WD40 repeat domain-containing protein [Pseudomonadota bacterium]
MLIDKHGGVQRWRTQPWAPDGDEVEIKGDVDNQTIAGPLLGEALLSDDGATMVMVSDANLKFRSFDARRMRLLHTLVLDTSRGRATAWALRHDSKQLAIGTMSGQIALWDLASGAVEWLPSRMGGWVAKLSFSADDSRLAAISNEPSEFRVFDPRSGEPVAMPVSLDDTMSPNALNNVEFGPDASTVLTQHYATRAILWQLPEAGYPPQAAVAAAPPMVALYARFALAHDARSHLMATSDNGQLKLWRVRWSPFVGGRAAPMVSDTLRFDGRHLVSVDANRVTVFDVATGRSVGKTIVLPEAPTFAGLDGSGERLIAIAGREISCWNWRDGKSCWPAITLPDSPLHLGMAAHAPMLAVSTGGNKDRRFFERVRLIDLATGRQRGAPVVLRGPLGPLRLSDDGKRLLAFEQCNTLADDSNVLRVIDTGSAKIVQNLVNDGKPRAQIIDARFADDGSVWSLSGPPAWGGDQQSLLWHWDSDGKLLDKTVIDPDFGSEFGLLPLPHGRGVIETDWVTVFDNAGRARRKLSVPDEGNRVNVDALSPDGKLLALADLDGVSLFVVDRNQRLVPDFKLALPNHDAIRQLAFAPDGSRLIGRTMSGHWFKWRIASDTRPVATIAQDLHLRDFTDLGFNERGKSAPPLPAEERRKLRAADPGSTPAPTPATLVNADVTAPVPDARYEPLNLDAIANVDPREPMNRATRVPPQPQSLPTLPRGLQRYDGVDFMLGRAVQLSGSPHNRLDTEFPAQSPTLRIAPQHIAAVDALVFQFNGVAGETGVVRLYYANGGERDLDILDGRDTYALLDLAAIQRQDKPRIGWLGAYSTDIRGWGISDSGDAAAVPTNVVRLANPEPDRPVAAISLEAPPTASPGLLYLALTLEPIEASPTRH